jgi:16S rRNA (cytosine1402-N4)-methyltransferase
MAAEVCALLRGINPRLIVDATVGTGGHAEALLGATQARVIGLDRDESALSSARERLAGFGARISLHHANFGELDRVLDDAGCAMVDGILADLGMSSFALDDPTRGFSFRVDGPLDMRMDRTQTLTARDLVNGADEAELARMLRDYGEEHGARRIARTIVRARGKRPITMTGELRAIVERAVGPHRRGAIHPATRTFQALRIAVNRELENLDRLLEAGPTRLGLGGRMVLISYHSLEDRAVKLSFRKLVAGGEYESVTRKALTPQSAELLRNPRSRSAKLRCVERIRSGAEVVA